MALFLSGLVLLIVFFWYFATDHERRKRNIGTFLLAGVCALSLLAIFSPGAIKGGIDLVGGTSFTLQVQPKTDELTGQPISLTTDDVNQAKNVIAQRINALGTNDAIPTVQGTDRIVLQLPGMKEDEAKDVRTQIEKVARLEVRRVNSEGFTPGPNGKTLAERIKDNEEARIPGYKVYQYDREREGVKTTQYLLLSNRIAWTGKDVQQAYPETKGTDHIIGIQLTGAGGDKMFNLTKDMVPGQDFLAVVLDGKVILSSSLREKGGLGKNFQIDGQESFDEARNLANALKNPLENPLKIIEERTVTPTLGAAVVKQGVWAGIVGLSCTALFVLIYYRTAGLIALFGLIVNTLMIFGGMAVFGFTFTLPGIAGMILSVGMAVDANVLIYERLREEMAAGKPLKVAISASYDKAFSAIFDSNLTSLITAGVLFWIGSGTIKGFAVTVVIGLLASMFSAILVTRVLFRWVNDLNILKKLNFLNLIKPTKIDFMKMAKPAYIATVVLLLTCIGASVFRGEKALGIDFTGGTVLMYQLPADKEVAQTEVENALGSLQTSKLPVTQVERSVAGELLTIRCATEDSTKIIDHLRESLPATLGSKTEEGTFAIQPGVDTIEPSLGMDFLKNAGLALAAGMLGILIYMTVRFEFSFALGGFVALLHDVLLTAGVVILFGGELSLIHVGALLTIAGYSVNDTIVIFDRIRESLRDGDGDTRELMNEAINATLSRTVLTSISTIVTVAILTFFGGSALKDFSAMILVGLVIATFSSVFIASPVVLWWSNRKGGSLRKEILQTTLAESDIQATP
ncbi:protein translocase subunit SecD [Luteolibacter flavescens]|uniref:Multifunctional fusion protein n=1 Tax=Luteolibacter flavescens TaxID=1859460 RepID=A0ABT3FJ95_9BACT|nr:protein translocase subunit SecD [Luteolibacter flavescens]MCW1883636.1 protein translocase subunit SecD [Luteolibacter flavescens]